MAEHKKPAKAKEEKPKAEKEEKKPAVKAADPENPAPQAPAEEPKAKEPLTPRSSWRKTHHDKRWVTDLKKSRFWSKVPARDASPRCARSRRSDSISL